MDFAPIRRLVIIAMFSDDKLMAQFALKGGNALNLVYGIGARSSIDVDLSMEGDFDNPADAERRILRALRDRFDSAGYLLFDEKFTKRPGTAETERNEKWGGYQVEFKLIPKVKFDELARDLEVARRNALPVSPSQQRIFKVQISKHEYCASRAEMEFDDYTIYVYTPAMIAIEKLRAICQQMPEYPMRGYATPRSRDFYDIYAVVTEARVNLGTPENLELIRTIFAAKQVPLNLIPRIPHYREFHRPDWPAVVDSVSGPLRDFDFYFAFLTDEIHLLEALWVE